MIRSEFNDTDRLRIIRYDCEISRGGRIVHERHTLTFIPRNAMGELCPLQSVHGLRANSGAWTLTDEASRKIGDFAKAGELVKYAKSYLTMQSVN